MRICLVSEEFPLETQKGGIATYQYLMAKIMLKNKCDVHIICKTASAEDKYIVYEGINLHMISEKNEENYRKRVCGKMKELENEIDIFEVADWKAEAHYYISDRKKPVVIKLHTPYIIWNKFNEVKETEEAQKVSKYEIEDILNSDAIYSCSESLKNLLKKEIIELENKEIRVVNNPIIQFEMNRKEKVKKDIILYVGSLEQRKGVLVLANELNDFFEKDTFHKVVFIGKDTHRNKFNRSTKELIINYIEPKYRDRVFFLGHLSFEKISKYYSDVKVAIFPSLYENFPYVLIEAMNFGCVCIGSKNGGMSEIIEDGINGFLCNPYKKGDILKKIEKVILLEEKKYKEISKNAKVTLKKVAPDKIFKETMEVYKEAIKSFNNDRRENV
ncbi:glycosyltransferase family 4 protein [Gemella cuniculi]|uniref:glycosyltransferase family 4 protein n=1 Tax=Gemella cuniculi TaxID=150240 RepID=UPI000409F6D8|nr:glycosyltransferase family 4 protein [Gemella cuniculi]